jgi:hypothetical protein
LGPRGGSCTRSHPWGASPSCLHSAPAWPHISCTRSVPIAPKSQLSRVRPANPIGPIGASKRPKSPSIQLSAPFGTSPSSRTVGSLRGGLGERRSARYQPASFLPSNFVNLAVNCMFSLRRRSFSRLSERTSCSSLSRDRALARSRGVRSTGAIA